MTVRCLCGRHGAVWRMQRALHRTSWLSSARRRVWASWAWSRSTKVTLLPPLTAANVSVQQQDATTELHVCSHCKDCASVLLSHCLCAAVYLLDNLDSWESFAGSESQPARIYPVPPPLQVSALLRCSCESSVCQSALTILYGALRAHQAQIGNDMPCCNGPSAVGAFLDPSKAWFDIAERGSAAFHAGLRVELCAATISGAPGEEGGGQEHLLQDLHMGRQEVMLLSASPLDSIVTCSQLRRILPRHLKRCLVVTILISISCWPSVLSTS